MDRLRCAYIASNYPAVSHTFILREILALRGIGVEVESLAIRRSPATEVLSGVDREEYRRTHALLPASPLTVARAHVKALRRSPAAYVSTLVTALRLSPGGARKTLWQLFYFAESIMTWAWMESRALTHLHAHHGNVACDVALLATRFANAAEGDGSSRRWSWTFTLHGPVELYEVKALKLPVKARHADVVAVTSDYVRSQLMAHLDPEDWEKLRVVRGGVDVSSFAPVYRTRPGGPLRIVNVARLAPVKGQFELLKAIAELRRRGVPASVVVVGEGPLRSAVESEIRRLELGDLVELTGSVSPDDIHRYYADADVFCLPSFAEGVPNVLMEAMAMELAVVSTRLMGIPELVEDGVSGLLVAPARPDLLADALQRLAEDAELRARLGRAARKRVIAEYRIDRTAREMRDLIDDAMREGGGSEELPPSGA